MDCLHLLKAAERVALWDELRDGTLVQCASNQQHNVVDHVAVPTDRHSVQLPPSCSHTCMYAHTHACMLAHTVHTQSDVNGHFLYQLK